MYLLSWQIKTLILILIHIISRPAQVVAEGGVRLLLSKSPAVSFSCLLWCPVSMVSAALIVLSYKLIVRLVCIPADYVVVVDVVDSSLAFFKEMGSSSGVTPSLVRLHRHVR